MSSPEAEAVFAARTPNACKKCRLERWRRAIFTCSIGVVAENSVYHHLSKGQLFDFKECF
jgi:hypothetical protein